MQRQNIDTGHAGHQKQYTAIIANHQTRLILYRNRGAQWRQQVKCDRRTQDFKSLQRSPRLPREQ